MFPTYLFFCSVSPFSIYHPLFLFSPSRHPQDLHSFPTRRSSDLCEQDGDQHHDRPDLDPCQPRLHAAARADAGVVHRSEEHTSELQSLRHLVCRLLLEKKKKVGTVTLKQQQTITDITIYNTQQQV